MQRLLIVLMSVLGSFKASEEGKTRTIINSTNTTSLPRRNETTFLRPGMTLEEFCASLGPNFSMEDCVCSKIGRICDLLKKTSEEPNKNYNSIRCGSTTFVKAVFFICLSTIGFIANLVVVLLSKQNWNSSPFCHKLIGGLALADLLFLAFTLMQFVPGLWTCRWIYNRAMCKFLFPVINMTATMGLGFVLIISVERFIGITHPFSRGMTPKAIYTIVSLNVLVSIASVLPAGVVLNDDTGMCAEQWGDAEHSRIYTWVLFVTSFAVPVTVISALYISMLYQLHRSHVKSLRSMNTCHPVLSKRKQENQRVMLIVFSLLVSFVLFVSPNRVYWILKDEGIMKKFSRSTIISVKFACDLAYVFHAVVNPIIYSVIDVKFRSSLKRLLCRNSSGRNRSHYCSNIHSSVPTTTSFSDLSNTSSVSGRRESRMWIKKLKTFVAALLLIVNYPHWVFELFFLVKKNIVLRKWKERKSAIYSLLMTCKVLFIY